jgi:hypothetical protein
MNPKLEFIIGLWFKMAELPVLMVIVVLVFRTMMISSILSPFLSTSVMVIPNILPYVKSAYRFCIRNASLY